MYMRTRSLVNGCRAEPPAQTETWFLFVLIRFEELYSFYAGINAPFVFRFFFFVFSVWRTHLNLFKTFSVCLWRWTREPQTMRWDNIILLCMRHTYRFVRLTTALYTLTDAHTHTRTDGWTDRDLDRFARTKTHTERQTIKDFQWDEESIGKQFRSGYFKKWWN